MLYIFHFLIIIKKMYNKVPNKIIEHDGESFIMYNWEINSGHYFKGCNIKNIFPDIIELYNNSYTNDELLKIKTTNYCIRVKLYSDDNKSYIQVGLVKINGFNDKFIKNLFNNLPNNIISCEINLGPFAHFMAIHKNNIITKKLTHEFILNEQLSYKGMVMLGRDSYTGETQENITDIIDNTGMFIIHNNEIIN